MMRRDKDVSAQEGMAYYQKSLSNSQDLYLFNLLTFLRVTEYAKEDLERKSSKYLPKEEDTKFTAKLFENDLVAAMHKEKEFFKLTKKKKLDSYLDEDSLKKYYKEFAATESYKKYIYEEEGEEADRKALLALFRFLAKNDGYQEDMEDRFASWEDDRSLVIGAMKKTIKSLPDSPEMYRTFRPDYEASVEFGEFMLNKLFEVEGELEALIEPALENWKMDRVADIDMILLKMAICEFLYCETIPTKVTLNEYVELAKLYSTDKSKDFVNGILDKMMKKLEGEGKISKTGRGLTG
ncbi:MAG: transcription antitermination factor NusB [Saprospiraceae bacterium]|nr:transcription antitermination factor NusB [Saprospiraceae bacterium]